MQKNTDQSDQGQLQDHHSLTQNSNVIVPEDNSQKKIKLLEFLLKDRETFYVRSQNKGFELCLCISKVIWPSFRDLRLWQCNIGSEGCRQLIKGQFPSLKILQLDTRCLHLRKGQWPALETLSLWNNGITSQGAILLREGQWAYLQQLSLQNLDESNNNTIIDLSFLYVSKKLVFNRMRCLKLCNNIIESVEVLSLIDTPFLQKIDLTQNRISNIDSIRKINSRFLKYLSLVGNPLKEISGIEHVITDKFELLDMRYWFVYHDSIQEIKATIKPLAKCSFKIEEIKFYCLYEKQACLRLEQKYEVKVSTGDSSDQDDEDGSDSENDLNIEGNEDELDNSGNQDNEGDQSQQNGSDSN